MPSLGVMDVLGFGLFTMLGQGSNPCPSLDRNSSSAASLVTPWPSWRMGILSLELSYTLQAKGLHIVIRKGVSGRRLEPATFRCLSRLSQTFCLGAIEAVSRNLLLVEVMVISLGAYLVKRTAKSQIRSCDLESRSPERSRGAIMAL